MFRIWDASNFRRTTGALCLVLAPLLFAISEASYPIDQNAGPAEMIVSAGRHHGLLLADVYLGITAAILFVPAIFALLHVMRGRGVVLAHVGAILAIVGVALAHLVLNGFQLMVWAMTLPGVDQQAMTRFLTVTMSNPAGAPIVLGHELFALGVIILGIALVRSGFGYRWAGPVISAAVVIDIVLGSTSLPDVVSSVVSDGLLVIGFAAVAYRLFTLPDSAWEKEEGAVGAPAAASAQLARA